MTIMNDIYSDAENNLTDIPAAEDPLKDAHEAGNNNEMFPIKLVPFNRNIPPVIVDVHPLHTIKDIIEAAREKLCLGKTPLSEITVTYNGHSTKPSDTIKALGLHKGMVSGDDYPVLHVDPSGSNGGTHE